MNTVIGAALGAGGTPGAVLAPIAGLATSVAIDYALEVRDFVKASNRMRSDLEALKLNFIDYAEANQFSHADADRYCQWIDTAIHAMGYP